MTNDRKGPPAIRQLRTLEEVCQACGKAITAKAIRISYINVRKGLKLVPDDYYHLQCYHNVAIRNLTQNQE